MKMHRDYAPETLSLVNRLIKAGFSIVSVFDGEENTVPATAEEAVKIITNLDESRLYVRTPEGKRLGLFLVLGNSPGEIVCDCHCHPLMDEVTEAHYSEWDGKEQPMKPAAY